MTLMVPIAAMALPLIDIILAVFSGVYAWEYISGR